MTLMKQCPEINKLVVSNPSKDIQSVLDFCKGITAAEVKVEAPPVLLPVPSTPAPPVAVPVQVNPPAPPVGSGDAPKEDEVEEEVKVGEPVPGLW